MKVSVPRWMATAIVCVLLLVPGVGQSQGEDNAGTVVRLKGSAVAMQDAQPRGLKVGDKILLGDVISTGSGARLEIRMLDNAVMTLGEKTIFVVIDFTAGGAEPNAAMRLLQGAFNAVSGEMMKTAGARFTVETETATIGIRGTAFWAGMLEGVFQVALWDGKALFVENKTGRVVIDRAGDGTTVRAADIAPTPPKTWGQGKIDRAKAMVAF